MLELQKNLLTLNINDERMEVDDYSDKNIEDSSEDDIPKFNEKKRRRKGKGKERDHTIQSIRNIGSSSESYEIEQIVGHKYENNTYLFSIKWKNYGHKHNSWLSSDKFNEKDLLIVYIEKHNIDIEL